MLIDALGLVQIEVTKPELREGEHRPAFELDDSGMYLIRLSPGGELYDAPGDNEMYQPHHLSEVQRNDLSAPSRMFQRPAQELHREPRDPCVGDVVPKDLRPDYLLARGRIPEILGDYCDFGQLRRLGGLLDKTTHERGDAVFVYRRRHGVRRGTDLLGHPANYYPQPRKGEHVYIVVR